MLTLIHKYTFNKKCLPRRNFYSFPYQNWRFYFENYLVLYFSPRELTNHKFHQHVEQGPKVIMSSHFLHKQKRIQSHYITAPVSTLHCLRPNHFEFSFSHKTIWQVYLCIRYSYKAIYMVEQIYWKTFDIKNTPKPRNTGNNVFKNPLINKWVN